MARTLSTLLAGEVVKTVTAPFFLIQLGWTPISYLSTGPTTAYAGQSWISGTATLESLTTTPGGGLEGSISLTNTDDSMGALVLGADLSQTAVAIWAAYGAGPFAAGDLAQIFDGVIDGADISATRVQLGIVSSARRRQTGPRLYCQPPLCNHIPPAGKTITWGGAEYTFESGAAWRPSTPQIFVRSA